VIPAYPVYLFDLDGTLLDSAVDICGAVRQVLLATNECPDLSYEFLKSYIGRHLIDLSERCSRTTPRRRSTG